jgi:hypothetical protein
MFSLLMEDGPNDSCPARARGSRGGYGYGYGVLTPIAT